MGERLKKYISFIENRLNEQMSENERERLRTQMLIQISFFQHERLIHLIVTTLFALLSILTFFAALKMGQLSLWALLLLFMALLVPYIVHYYKLENGVQKLYRLYDRVADFSEIS